MSGKKGPLTGYKVVLKSGKYTIGNIVGEGSFAAVYKATREKDSRVMAIKVVQKSTLVGKNLENIKREIEITRSVQHPNVLSLADVFETDQQLFLVTDFLAGGELYKKIVDRGSYTEVDAVKIVRQFLSGLVYLHSQGICHRDLKPENLLCSEDTTAEGDFTLVIADFGLSRKVSVKQLMETRCGSLHYLAPEVILAHPYTNACDLWSLGVITFVILTGMLPFDDAKAITEGKYHTEELHAVSASAKDFIAKLLVVDPTRRMDGPSALQHAWLASEPPPAVDLRASMTVLKKKMAKAF
jgi:calcium/calmodulin-dependent protein kinase I